MEPTISLSIDYFFYLLCFWYLVGYNFFFSRHFTCILKKEKIVVGKVRVANAIGILILYIGKIRFVINRLRRGKRITKRKEIH